MRIEGELVIIWLAMGKLAISLRKLSLKFTFMYIGHPPLSQPATDVHAIQHHIAS